MNLRIKFNLVMALCCAISFVIIYLHTKSKIEANILFEIENKAQIVLDVSDKIDNNSDVSSYFSTSDLLQKTSGSLYQYNIAFTNAKSNAYQANIWQQKIIDSFDINQSNLVFSGIKFDEKGEFFVLSEAISNVDNQIIGGKFLIIYKKSYEERLKSQLNQLLVLFIVTFIVLLLVINLLLHFLIFKPIQLISKEAERISRGQSTVEELKIGSSDEISELSQSFNRIIRSLKAAMKLLNH